MMQNRTKERDQTQRVNTAEQGTGRPGGLREWIAYGVYGLIALAIMLPLFKPGFILTLDMVFTPELRMPESVTSSYLFHAGLHVLNLVIPSDILQKIMMLGILLLSVIGMHRLVRLLQPTSKEGEWGIYFASIFFMMNPFVYSRFMAGQYAVLLGYALLPWFARLLLQFMHRPSLVPAAKLGGLGAIIGILSVHTIAALLVLGLAAPVVVLWRYRQKVQTFIKFGFVAAGLFVVLSSYWLVPLALGKGETAQAIQTFTTADTTAFATNGGNVAAQIGNVLRLQGFWAEDKNQFLLPQDRAILWGLMSLIILALVITGALIMWRKSRALAVFFGASGLTAIIIAAGVFSPVAQNLPLFAGLREPHKIVALLALSYAVFAAFGVNAFLQWIRDKAETAYSVAAVVILLLPFAFMRVMFWGFNGQLVPRQYPADWTTINQRLQQDNNDYAVLFLPWHQYMSFGFSGRIIANPAPAFFEKSMVVSTDPELEGATSGKTDDREKAVKNMLAQAKINDNFAGQIAKQNIKYVLLAKEVDYKSYDYVIDQPGLQQVADYPTATLYLNTAWEEK